MIVHDVSPMDGEYTCTICGAALTYSGRGRKPSKCTANNDGDSACYGTGKSDVKADGKLAKQALAVLRSWNQAVGLAALGMGMSQTCGAVRVAQVDFESRVLPTLEADPGLCRTIIGAGKKGGKLALIFAYAAFGAQVGAVAVPEFRELRAAKRDEGQEG